MEKALGPFFIGMHVHIALRFNDYLASVSGFEDIIIYIVLISDAILEKLCSYVTMFNLLKMMGIT